MESTYTPFACRAYLRLHIHSLLAERFSGDSTALGLDLDPLERGRDPGLAGDRLFL
jgi:hypothetical protein